MGKWDLGLGETAISETLEDHTAALSPPPQPWVEKPAHHPSCRPCPFPPTHRSPAPGIHQGSSVVSPCIRPGGTTLSCPCLFPGCPQNPTPGRASPAHCEALGQLRAKRRKEGE